MSALYGGAEPPHNEEAEAAVLSAILTSPATLDEVRELLTEEDFYRDANRRIYEACCQVQRSGAPVDLQTVAGWMRDRDRLVAAGGVAYIARIINATPAVAHVAAHAAIVRDKARVRRLQDVCGRILAESHADAGDAQAFLESAEQRIYELTRQETRAASAQMYDLVMAEHRRIERRRAGEDEATGLPSGLHHLDELTGGMRPGEITIVAARPGGGKSAFVVGAALATASATKTTRGVLVHSLEMSSAQTTRRALGITGQVNMRTIDRGMESLADWERYMAAANDVSALPIWVDDRPRLTPTQLRASVRRHRAAMTKGELSLVCVDYVQKMRPEQRRTRRDEEIGDNIEEIAATAKELGVHILVAAQLNRENTKRAGNDRRPRMEDLAGSGQIEREAHTIVMLHRPHGHDHEATPTQKEQMELLVEKQRDGRTGMVLARFVGEHTRLHEPTEADIAKWRAA